METIAIIKEQGHILIPIGDKRAVLDTGSPGSMAPEPFTFLGVQHNKPTHIGGITPQTMSEVAGFNLDILIGCDILSQHTIRLRYQEGCLDIGEDILDGSICNTLEMSHGYPLFPLRLWDKPAKALLDTGAKLSYIDPAHVTGQAPAGQQEDFYPYVGRFTTDIYTVPTFLDGTSVVIEYGVMPHALALLLGAALQITQASAVVGTQLLQHYDCTISWPRKTISWTRVA